MAEIDTDSQNRWILGEQLAGVAFRLGQHVRVIAGAHAGVSGVLISIYELGSDPVYHVESRQGDHVVRQSELAPDE